MPRLRWKDNIKIDLKDIINEGVECNHLAQDMFLWRTLVKILLDFRLN